MKRLANLLLLTDCQQARDTMIRTLHKVGVCAKDSTSKGVCIDVIYADTLSRFRRSLGLPRFMTTVGYEKWMDGDSSIANLVSTSSSNSKPSIAAKYQNLSLMEIMRNFSRYAQPKPNLPFEFEIPSCCSYIDDREVIGIREGLKEIVIGTGSHTSPTLVGSMDNRRRHKALPIYEMDHGVHIRLLPSTSSYLVFTGNGSEIVEERYGDQEVIGQTNSSQGQIQILNDRDMIGVDVRICNEIGIKPYFNEGTEILLENSLPELQNSRVLDTSLGNDPNSHNFGFAGDCWSEVHQMIKRPFAFMNKHEASRAERQQKSIRRRDLDVSLKE